MYLFALAMTFLITSCGQKKGEDTALVRPVKTATVSSQSVILKDFSGMVEAVEYVKLAFRVSGQIINLPVVEGQRVKKGQLIAAIDPRDISLQYAADKAAYETAAAQVERNKRLLGRQAISLQEYEISVANYQKAKSAYELSTNNMRDTKLLAPFDGSIETRLVENYQRVNSGEGIVRLVNARLEEYLDISTDGTGIPVTIIIDDAAFDRTIYDVKPGFTCNIRLASDIAPFIEEKLMNVPLSAVFGDSENKNTYVWIVKDNKVNRREVTVYSPTGEANLLISKGLKPGETVVTAGVYQLVEGQRIKEVK